MLHSVFIRNMFSKGCIVLVTGIFRECGLDPSDIVIGRVRLPNEPTEDSQTRLRARLGRAGYAVNTNPRAALSFEIKQLLVQLLEPEVMGQKKKSDFLSQRLKYEYNYLSAVFTEVEGLSIEKYFIRLKVARIRELIETADIRFVDIAYQLGYSSQAHLTTQFKKEVGITPSQYRTRLAEKSGANKKILQNNYLII